MAQLNYIIKGIGGFYYVKTADGVIECKAKGIFRKMHITPVAGDIVRTEKEQGTNVIAEILPRKNVFVRPPIANVDNYFIVVSTVQPVPSTLVIDKLTAIAVSKNATPILVITKADLAQCKDLEASYRLADIQVVCTKQGTQEGLDEICTLLPGKTSVFGGNSGVGKSTLLGALLPDLELKTGEISQKLGRGRHTTREVTLYEAFGGLVADTPGFASLDMERACHIPKEELQDAFPDIARFAGMCKFNDCVHMAEKGCAVRAAVQDGLLAQSRYDSYCTLYAQAKEVKEWQK